MAYIVDMRSDTVTKPTKNMEYAMVNSALGDDVFGEDPTVIALEKKIQRVDKSMEMFYCSIQTINEKIATILGKQTALFVPSGTMSNLIAVMVHCNKRGSEAIVGESSHIYRSEQGGASHLGGVLLSTLRNNPDGTFDLEELEGRIRGSGIHEPVTSLVAVENTHNYCGGKVIPLKWLDDLAEICNKHSLPIHMDGARLFNACEYLKVPPEKIVKHCSSISVCFSKGLSAPVGSALVGSYQFIEKARRLRKMLGGGMRQAGVLAAAALVAIDEVVPLLSLDHKRAQRLAKVIEGLFLKTFIVDVENQHTNIVLVRIPQSSPATAETVVQRLSQVSLSETQGDCKTANGEGVILKAITFNSKTIRFTVHKEIADEDLWLAIIKITYVFKEIDAKYNK